MNLHEFLEYKKMNQTELAEYLDLSRLTVHRLLQGQETKLSIAFQIQTKTKGLVKVKDLYDFYVDQKSINIQTGKISKKDKRIIKVKD